MRPREFHALALIAEHPRDAFESLASVRFRRAVKLLFASAVLAPRHGLILGSSLHDYGREIASYHIPVDKAIASIKRVEHLKRLAMLVEGNAITDSHWRPRRHREESSLLAGSIGEPDDLICRTDLFVVLHLVELPEGGKVLLKDVRAQLG